MKQKLNKSVLCFCFGIHFKNNLVLLLGFKVINVKNLYLKILKRIFNIFQLINFCDSRIHNWQLYLCKKKIEPHVFVFSILQFIWQDLATAYKSSIEEK